MEELSDSLKYRKWYSPRCDSLISTDSKNWNSCEITEISASSLKLESSETYAIGEKLYFKLILYSGCSAFDMRVQAKIISKLQNFYEVQFTDIQKHHQIQLDEIIKSNAQKNNDNLNHHHKFEEGVYTFAFTPVHRSSVKLRKRV